MATNSSLKNQLQTQGGNSIPKKMDIPTLVSNHKVVERFTGVLGSEKKAQAFLGGLVAMNNNDTNIAKCDPQSVINVALTSATLGLPLNKELGMAWVIPYGNKATFQLGVNGLIRLALQSGVVKKITATPIYEGQLKGWNPLFEEIELDFDNKESDVVVGYVGMVVLNNGFTKVVYMTKKEMDAHKSKYSKGGIWSKEYDKMAMKTVLKKLIRYCPISFEILAGINADGGFINEVDENDLSNSEVEYIDVLDSEVEPMVMEL